jgi:hypothetical protein
MIQDRQLGQNSWFSGGYLVVPVRRSTVIIENAGEPKFGTIATGIWHTSGSTGAKRGERNWARSLIVFIMMKRQVSTLLHPAHFAVDVSPYRWYQKSTIPARG